MEHFQIIGTVFHANSGAHDILHLVAQALPHHVSLHRHCILLPRHYISQENISHSNARLESIGRSSISLSYWSNGALQMVHTRFHSKLRRRWAARWLRLLKAHEAIVRRWMAQHPVEDRDVNVLDDNNDGDNDPDDNNDGCNDANNDADDDGNDSNDDVNDDGLTVDRVLDL